MHAARATSPIPLQPREVALDAPAFSELAQTLLHAGHAIRFRATGASMRPFVRDGDFLTVVPAPAADCRPGDIVLHRAGAGLVAHRLLARRGSGTEIVLLIRGDAACREPDSVPAAAILGRATHQERHGRTRRLDSWPARLRGLIWALRQNLRRWVRRG